MRFSIYRYNPDVDTKPRMQDYEIELEATDPACCSTRWCGSRRSTSAIVPPLVPRRRMRLRCDEHQRQERLGMRDEANDLTEKIVLQPLPGLPVVRDLIVDFSQFFNQYHSVQPYLITRRRRPKERLQSPQDREELDGLYECILCASCSTSCPSFLVESRTNSWVRPVCCRPTGLLRTRATKRPTRVLITYRLFRCHSHHELCRRLPERTSIRQRAIGKIKDLLVKNGTV